MLAPVHHHNNFIGLRSIGTFGSEYETTALTMASNLPIRFFAIVLVIITLYINDNYIFSLHAPALLLRTEFSHGHINIKLM